MVVEVGKKIVGFTCLDHEGNRVSLADFKGKHVVLYFYPKDMTPGCTTQACDFKDVHKEFGELDTVILGVSPDSEKSHQKFIAKYNLPFVLLADEDHKLAKQFGVWQLKKTFGREYYGIVRSTFIIDKEGILRKEFRNIRVKGHVEKALTYVREHLT